MVRTKQIVSPTYQIYSKISIMISLSVPEVILAIIILLEAEQRDPTWVDLLLLYS